MGMSRSQPGSSTVWTFTVLDVDDQSASLFIRAEGGYVTCSAPRWWKADTGTSAKIRAAQEEAEDLARRQRGS